MTPSQAAFACCSLAAVAWLVATGPTMAHPGGLNAEGCHNNRKTGDYHCHRSSAAPVRLTSSPSPQARPSGAYPNCAAARAAGAAPVRRGQPGYGKHLDRDDDGVGCE
jgi:hypothetical protein